MRVVMCAVLLAAAAALPAAAEEVPSLERLPAPVQLASSFEILDVLLTPDGKYLVTGGSQRYRNYEKREVTQSALTLWDVEAGKVVRTGNLQAPYDLYDRGVGPRVHDLALSTDGRTLLVYLDTRQVELLSFPELASQAVIDVRKANAHYYRAGAFSPDGTHLALGDNDGELSVWAIAERALVKRWKSHKKAITHLAFSPDGKVLAAGGHEDFVLLWSVPQGKELREIDDLEGATSGLEFSRDGTHLAIGTRVKGFAGQVRVWSMPRKRFVAEKPCMVMFPVVRLAYSPDGKRLAYSCSTFLEKGVSLVRILDLASEKLAATLHYETMTQGVLYLPDGQRLVTVQKREINSKALSEKNQSVAVWAIDPPKFLHYLHDPGAKP